MELVGETINQ